MAVSERSNGREEERGKLLLRKGKLKLVLWEQSGSGKASASPLNLILGAICSDDDTMSVKSRRKIGGASKARLPRDRRDLSLVRTELAIRREGRKGGGLY
jgi:hypothetical protein